MMSISGVFAAGYRKQVMQLTTNGSCFYSQWSVRESGSDKNSEKNAAIDRLASVEYSEVW